MGWWAGGDVEGSSIFAERQNNHFVWNALVMRAHVQGTEKISGRMDISWVFWGVLPVSPASISLSKMVMDLVFSLDLQ